MSSPPARPTLITVARLAGVSVASASRVLTGGQATPEMDRRVREAATALGYVPDMAARSLRARRTSQLAFAVPDVGNPAYVAMMRGIESVTRESGYRLLVQSTGGDIAEEMSVIQGLGQRYVDGLIIVPIRITDELLRALAVTAAPIAVITSLPDSVPVDNVRTDSVLGVSLVVKHMLASGRRAFAMLNGPTDTVPGAERIRGFEAAVDVAGLRPVAVESASDFTYAAGLDAARTLLTRCQPDAIVCGNDLLAFAMIRALREHGLDVPGDVAVAGIDDIDLAEMHLPSLTSVSLESGARGQLAARMLLDRIGNPDLPPRREKVLPRLVVRESA
ncbi:MAG TPA: LacI family DNA-binding transcriptional regulator [Trebonia sp.]|nr:LacI family DNA-binding transcriptional regulator [Trebonia sp.]